MMESKQKSMFVQFALEPLWKVCSNSVGVEGDVEVHRF